MTLNLGVTSTTPGRFYEDLLYLASAVQRIVEGRPHKGDWEIIDEYTDIRGNLSIGLPLSAMPADPRSHEGE